MREKSIVALYPVVKRQNESLALGFVATRVLEASAMKFGIMGRASGLAGLTSLPIALWEFSLGVWLAAKGFNRSATESLQAKTETQPALSPA